MEVRTRSATLPRKSIHRPRKRLAVRRVTRIDPAYRPPSRRQAGGGRLRAGAAGLTAAGRTVTTPAPTSSGLALSKGRGWGCRCAGADLTDLICFFKFPRVQIRRRRGRGGRPRVQGRRHTEQWGCSRVVGGNISTYAGRGGDRPRPGGGHCPRGVPPTPSGRGPDHIYASRLGDRFAPASRLVEMARTNRKSYP